jgi:hypothetical protein
MYRLTARNHECCVAAEAAQMASARAAIPALVSLGILRCFTKGRRGMKNSPKIWSMVSALTFSLAGCAAGGAPEGTAHLSATQCRDLTALKNNAPSTPERNRSELAALKMAGYDPSRFDNPHYPDDLHAAQRQVDSWYQVDCH